MRPFNFNYLPGDWSDKKNKESESAKFTTSDEAYQRIMRLDLKSIKPKFFKLVNGKMISHLGHGKFSYKEDSFIYTPEKLVVSFAYEEKDQVMERLWRKKNSTK